MALVCVKVTYSAFLILCLFAGRFGQTTPPLVDFLKDILRRYPEGGQILKVRIYDM